MRNIDYIFAIVLGLFAGAALFTKASQAPASYIGDFTAPWFAQICLFLSLLIPPPLLRLRLHQYETLRKTVWFIALLPILGGALGVYMAVRFFVEQPTKTAQDWLIVVLGTLVYVVCNGVLLYWSLKARK